MKGPANLSGAHPGADAEAPVSSTAFASSPMDDILSAMREIERASLRPMMVLSPRVAVRALWAAGGGRVGWRGPFGTRWHDFVAHFVAVVADGAPSALNARVVVSLSMTADQALVARLPLAADVKAERSWAASLAQGYVARLKAERAEAARRRRKALRRRKHGRR